MADKGIYRVTGWAVAAKWLGLGVGLMLTFLIGVYAGTSGAYGAAVNASEKSFVGALPGSAWILEKLSAIDAESKLHEPGLPSNVINMQGEMADKLRAIERDKVCTKFTLDSLRSTLDSLTASMERQRQAAEIIIRVNEGRCAP